MTKAKNPGPKGGTLSAPCDSGPALSLRYRLDWRDALAWERLPGELRGRQYAIYVGFLVVGGMTFGIVGEHLPDWLMAVPDLLLLLALVGVIHLVWMGYYALLMRHRARKRLPRPMVCIFEDWHDHIYIHTEAEEVSLSPDLSRQTVLTATHLFMDFPQDLVIVPMAAFPSPETARAFHQRWEAMANGAVD